MRHENSVFHQIQKHVPWTEFSKLVDKHQADYRTRRLTTKQQFLALLFGQLSGAVSLREIEDGLKSQSARLYHAGGCRVARTTLADANRSRPAGLFADLFAHMAATASRKTRRHIKDAARILDATRLQLPVSSGGWAGMVRGHRAVKLHVTYDLASESPVGALMTSQKVTDITPAKDLQITPGMTYVFDMAYYDFAWWAAIHAKGARFVTRLKVNTRVEPCAQNPVAADGPILSDHIGHLPERMARSRRNPFTDPVREIVVTISSGRRLRLITNDLDAPAHEIAALYKQRWEIELFFKWIKQHLKIRHFLGRNENAVRIQIFVALIAYLLLRAAQAGQASIRQPLAFARLVRLNIMHRKSIARLKEPPQHNYHDKRQLTLNLIPI